MYGIWNSFDANPLHPKKDSFNERDLMRRVAVSFREADDILGNAYKMCQQWLENQGYDTQTVVNRTLDVRTQIMAEALNTLNGYYNQEVKATVQQLYAAINAARREGMEPIQPPPTL